MLIDEADLFDLLCQSGRAAIVSRFIGKSLFDHEDSSAAVPQPKKEGRVHHEGHEGFG